MPELKLKHPLILASGSPVRQQMLVDIGLRFKVIPADIDEESLQAELKDFSIAERALKLAQLKAQNVSEQFPSHLILAADQMGEFKQQPLFKPQTLENNIAMLTELAGKTHYQYTAASLYLEGEELSHFQEKVSLTMRALTESEIKAYVALDKAYTCCGGYRFEGLGKHLFASFAGDYDSILGLPLLKILNFLYEQKLIILT